MYIYILLLIFIVIFLIALAIDKDIFCPLCIFCESYILSICMAILNKPLLGEILGSKAFYIFVYGIISFSLGYFVVKPSFRIKGEATQNETENINPIKISKIFIVMLIVVQLVAIIMQLDYVQKIAGVITLSNFSATMSRFRNLIIYSNVVVEKAPFLLNQFKKVSKVTAYVLLFVFFRNKLTNQSTSNSKYYYCVFALYIVSCFLSGERFDVIAFLIDAMVLWYILYQKYKNNSLLDIKQIFRIAISVILILVIFSSTRSLVGRKNNNGFIEYVASYFGNPIKLFDMFVNDNSINNNTDKVWGNETFYSVHKVINKLGFNYDYSNNHKEFRTYEGVVLGNVYTAYRSYYSDWGTMGVVIMQFLLGIIWRCLYIKLEKVKIEGKISKYMIFYAMIIHTLLFHSYSEQFFANVLSINMLSLIILLYIIDFLLTKVKFSWGGRRISDT